MLKKLLLKGRVICGLFCCLLLSLAASAQTRITGKVIGGDDRQPIIGASVRLRGTSFGTVTDAQGNFAITANRGQVLTVSYIGYVSKDITVGSAANYTVTLSSNSSELNQVVVTGYQAQRKRDVSTAVATVNVSQAKTLSTASADQLLQGQAAGVTVVTSGVPGQGANVYIRGIGNNGNSQPLYVVDGVQTNSMKDVNPNDIESISVLKDAGSAAIYGISGGNGVVIVTTKHGVQGKSTISYDAYYGTQTVKGGNVWNVLNADEYGQLLTKIDPNNALLINGKIADYGYRSGAGNGVANAGDAAVNSSLYKFDPSNPGNDYQIQPFLKGAGTDWFHTVFKNAPMQEHTISASGANDKNAYYMSVGYLNQQGTLLNTYYKRYNARVNTTFNIKDHIRLGEQGQVYFIQTPGSFTNLDEGNAISETYRAEPQIPVYDIAGNYGGTYAGPPALGNAVNPYAQQYRTANNHGRTWQIIGSVFAEADFLKHFTIRTQFSGSVNLNQYNTIQYNPYETGEGHATPNGAYEGSSYYSNYNWTNTIRYNQNFGKNSINFLGGYEAKSQTAREINAQGFNLFSTDPDFVNISNTTTNKVVTSDVPYGFPINTLSAFGQLNYNYAGKYYLTGTVRNDNTSVFAPGHRSGTFPSGSVAWRISQENFMKGVSWVNDMKIRGSYGVAGFSGNVPVYNAFTLFGQGSNTGYAAYSIDGSLNTPTIGYYNTSLGNTNVTWERDKTTDVGLDATLFGNKLDFAFDYFNKVSSKLLYSPTLPAATGGATSPQVNSGEVTNHGVEVALTYHIRPSSDLSFDVTANITTFKNTVTSFVQQYPVSGRNGTINTIVVGQEFGEFYGYKQIGYFSSATDVTNSPTQAGAAPGAFKYADINGDGKIDAGDRTYIGHPLPDFTYGFNLTAKYKNIDLLGVLYGSHGNQVYNQTLYYTEFYNSLTGNKSRDLLYNSWTPTNLNPATVAAGLSNSFSTSGAPSSYYVKNASFLKLRTLQLGYTFMPNTIKQLGIEKLRVYLQGANLFTITKYKGLDPEVAQVNANGGGSSNSVGIDFGNYPNNQKTYLVGVNLTF